MSGYAKRVWLNEAGHSSTGSVAAFHGEAPWNRHDGGRGEVTFLEIADCHCKVRLHRAELDTMDEFIAKLEKLRDMIDDFVTHLCVMDEEPDEPDNGHGNGV
jgi:hypothetical protein